jgi:hypothetical protein
LSLARLPGLPDRTNDGKWLTTFTKEEIKNAIRFPRKVNEDGGAPCLKMC